MTTASEIDAERRRLGLSLAKLARAADVPYDRLFKALPLRPDELRRVHEALAAAAIAKNAARAATPGGGEENDDDTTVSGLGV